MKKRLKYGLIISLAVVILLTVIFIAFKPLPKSFASDSLSQLQDDCVSFGGEMWADCSIYDYCVDSIMPEDSTGKPKDYNECKDIYKCTDGPHSCDYNFVSTVEPISYICNFGTFRCSGNMRQKCIGEKWIDWETCSGDCVNGICVTQTIAVSHASYECYNTNIYWFNSFGEREELKETCQYGCSNGVCLPEPVIEEPPVTPQVIDDEEEEEVIVTPDESEFDLTITTTESEKDFTYYWNKYGMWTAIGVLVSIFIIVGIIFLIKRGKKK